MDNSLTESALNDKSRKNSAYMSEDNNDGDNKSMDDEVTEKGRRGSNRDADDDDAEDRSVTPPVAAPAPTAAHLLGDAEFHIIHRLQEPDRLRMPCELLQQLATLL